MNKKLTEAVDRNKLANFIKKAVEDLKDGGEGTWYFYLGDAANGTELHYAIGGEESSAWDKEDLPNLATSPDKEWVICGKIAVNDSSMQADYEWDWVMPYFESGDVWDTDSSFSADEDYEQTASWVIEEFSSLSKYNIDEDGLITSKEGDEWDALLVNINNSHGNLKVLNHKYLGNNKFDIEASGYDDMFKLMFHTHLGETGGNYNRNTLIIDSIDIIESKIPEDRLKEILTPNHMIWDQGVYDLKDYLLSKNIIKYAPNGNDLVYVDGEPVEECKQPIKEDIDCGIDMEALEAYANMEEGENITVTADLLNVLEQALAMAKEHCKMDEGCKKEEKCDGKGCNEEKSLTESADQDDIRSAIYDTLRISGIDMQDILCDLVDTALSKAKRGGDVWDACTAAVDEGMTDGDDQWTAYRFYCDMGDDQDVMWESLTEDVFRVTSAILKNNDDVEDDHDDEGRDDPMTGDDVWESLNNEVPMNEDELWESLNKLDDQPVADDVLDEVKDKRTVALSQSNK